MSASRIVARGLGKEYRHYRRPLDRILEWASAGTRSRHQAEWALRGVSLEVAPGESLGIIGMNGAGKSTLLKILTGTTLPTEGTFEVDGTVTALLELGLGIQPDFTGWENARLACRLFGQAEASIEERLRWIQDFSELGAHMDQPVRTYSTGMQVRLAFSAATAIRPDVLVVDEALSVGDAYFQHKSMSRIRALQQSGTSLLFVTHDPAAVKSLCDRAILLDHGVVVREGAPDAVFDYYNALVAKKEADADVRQVSGADGALSTRSGSREAEIEAVEILDAQGRPGRSFETGQTVRIVCRLKAHVEMGAPTVGFVIRDRLGNDVFGSNTFHLAMDAEPLRAGESARVSFEVELRLGSGSYSVSLALHASRSHVEGNYDWWDRALVFEIHQGKDAPFTGVAQLPVRAGLVREG